MIKKLEEMKIPTKIQIDLTGPDGNAYCLLRYAKQYANQFNLDYKAISNDMMSGDYEHLLEVFDKNFEEFIDLFR